MILRMNNVNFLLLCAIFVGAFSACSLIKIEADVNPLPTNVLNARIMTHDFGGIILKTIDEAADSIIVTSDDAQIQLNALRWKINGISTSRNAIFQTDPILALVDTWIFMLQMQEFLINGAGKDAFGTHQDIAHDAMTLLVTGIDSIVISMVNRKEYDQHKAFVRYFVDTHPLADFSFTRTSVMQAWNDFTNTPDSLAIETVGNLPETVSDLTSRLTYYSNELPLQAQWNTELILREHGLDSLQIGQNLDSLAAMIENLNDLIMQTPELVDSAVVNLFPLFDRIDQKWSLTLRILQREREILLTALNTERQAVMTDLESISQNVARILMENIKSLIKEILIYIIILSIILLGLPFTMGFLVGRFLTGRKR